MFYTIQAENNISEQRAHPIGKSRFSPCETTTCPEQVHKGNTNKSIYIKDQVGFLKIKSQIKGCKCQRMSNHKNKQ